MSGGGGDTETRQVSEPWPGQAPYLADIFAQAKHLFLKRRPQYFPDPTVAPFSPETVQAQNYLRDFAGPGGGASQIINPATQAQQFALGPVLDVGNNPYVQGAARAAVNPVIDALTESALPAIRHGARAAGGFGGSRQQLAEGNAVRDATQAMIDRTAGMFERAYGEGLDTFGRGLALAPQTLQMGLTPAGILDTVGQQRRDYEQALIQDAINRHNFIQARPHTMLDQYRQAVLGNFGGVTTDTGRAPGGSTFGNILGGATGGAGLAGAIGLNPLLGAAAGGLLGLL